MCRLLDPTSSLYQRLVTYEGAEHNSVAGPLRHRDHSRSVKLACEAIAGHLLSTTLGGQAKRMVIFFKIDREGRANLLWGAFFKLETV